MVINKPTSPIIDWGNPLTKNLVFDAAFYEGAGASPLDIVGNTRGAFTNTPTWVHKKAGRGLSFSGNDTDKVTYTTRGFQNSPSVISAECLFIADATPTDGDRLFVKGNTGAGSNRYFQFGEWVNGQGIYIAADWTTSQGAWRTPLPTTGVLNHYVVTYNGTSTSNDPVAYLNGVLQTMTEVVTPAGTRRSDNAEAFIGNAYTGSDSWKGTIFYVRYWKDRILNQTEARQLYADPFRIYQRPIHRISVTAAAVVPSVFKPRVMFY